MPEPQLRVLDGRAVPPAVVCRDPDVFQAACVEAFVASWLARGFSAVTIENDTGLLDGCWPHWVARRGR